MLLAVVVAVGMKNRIERFADDDVVEVGGDGAVYFLAGHDVPLRLKRKHTQDFDEVRVVDVKLDGSSVAHRYDLRGRHALALAQLGCVAALVGGCSGRRPWLSGGCKGERIATRTMDRRRRASQLPEQAAAAAR